jgi:hypothetical protein
VHSNCCGPFCCRGGVDPPHASLDQIAGAVVQLFQFSPAQARNAYSAVLLLPGFEGLRFHKLLVPYKRQWNTNTEKYAAFWDPGPLLCHLALSTINELKQNLDQLRTQLILCCRLLCLYRSIDLAQIRRTVGVLGGFPSSKLKEKGKNCTNGRGSCPFLGALKFPPFI